MTPLVGARTLADARELLLRGSYEEAAEAFEALTKDAENAVATDRVAARMGVAACHARLGRYDEAIAALRQMGTVTVATDRATAENHAPWHFALAKVLRIKGRYGDAIQHLRTAIELDKSHAGARRVLAECLYLTGRRDEAIEAYRWFDRQLVDREDLPEDADWMTHTAVGFLRYSVLTRNNVQRRTVHILNQMLQVAYTRVDRQWWPARIASADVLRERHNNDDIDGSVADYQAALRINPKLPEAFIGMGEVALETWGFEAIEEYVAQALSVNQNFVPAFHLQAKKLILERRYDQAREACEKALAINGQDLTALSLSAAAAACQYDAAHLTKMSERIASVNPRCALFHHFVGAALSGVRQFPQAEERLRRAIELEPTDANPRTELGMMYMQWGREELARETLEAAWALDAFNQRTKFTLDLLDSLAKFATHETEHFLIKYDEARDPGLGIVAGDYLEQIYHEVVDDFDAHVAEKTIIELFPTQKSFGVRITGKPWIHTVGASTGRVIALASPREAPGLMGPYHLGRVLRHEFTHTVTLAATNNRIPHWFTEGLAVYEENSPRSFDWAFLLADAVRREQLFTLESIDWGFMRPRRPNDRQLAYAQSEWMCEFIVERFGYDYILNMLTRFKERQTLAQVIEAEFGWEQQAFDLEFGKWAREAASKWCFDLAPPGDVEKLRERAALQPDDAAVVGELARAEFDNGDFQQALTSARKALELDDQNIGAIVTFARSLDVLLSASGNTAAGNVSPDDVATLIGISVQAPDQWAVQKALAGVMLRREDWEAATQALKKLQHLCPMEPTSWKGLSGIYLRDGREDLALPQLMELAQWEQRDASVPAEIARIQVGAGRLREGRYWYRQALLMNPFHVATQGALADVYMRLDETRLALGVYALLTKLEPNSAAHFADAALAANKIGDKDQAKQWATLAVQLDAKSPAASLLE